MSRQPERNREFDRDVKPDGPDVSKPCWHEGMTDHELTKFCAANGCRRCAAELKRVDL